MYENLTYSKLKTIVDSAHEPCVSIYMPISQHLLEMQEKDIIRLRNLLDEAEAAVRTAAPDMRTPDVEDLLEPAKKLLREGRMDWQPEDAGMVIFLAPNFSRVMRFRLATKPLVVVGRHFHITPLLPLLKENEHFYILALSQKVVRLFYCDRFQIYERNLGDTPHSLAEALPWDDFERTLQRHTGNSRSPNSGQASLYHGHGIGSKEMHKQDLQHYLQQVAIGVKKSIGDENRPVVLAGVDYIVAMFRQHNQYPHLVEASLPGNPDELSPQELHNRAWALMHPLIDGNRSEATARYEELASKHQATDALRLILAAASEGRVETLFTAVDQHQWGHYDPDTGYIHLFEEAILGTDDLFNLAAIETIKNRGMLYPLAPDDVPGKSGIAAIYRY